MTARQNPYPSVLALIAIVSGVLGGILLVAAFVPRSSRFEPVEPGPLWLQVLAVLLLFLAAMSLVAWLSVSALRWQPETSSDLAGAEETRPGR